MSSSTKPPSPPQAESTAESVAEAEPIPPLPPYARMPTSLIEPPMIAFFPPYIKLHFLSNKSMSEFYSRPDSSHRSHDLELPRFDDADKPVLYQDLLGRGQEGSVFSALINGKSYAIKIFKPFEPFGPPQFTIDDLIKYLSPFASECRAFACIHRKHQDGIFAPKCYGWMKVSRKALRKFGIERSSISSYAIVKELINDDTSPEHLPHIQSGLKSFYKMGITVVDASPENYKGSRLVDFGNACTWPHRCWSRYCHDISLRCNLRRTGNWKWEESHIVDFKPV